MKFGAFTCKNWQPNSENFKEALGAMYDDWQRQRKKLPQHNASPAEHAQTLQNGERPSGPACRSCPAASMYFSAAAALC